MAFVGICPYFVKERDSTAAYCECAKIKLPDRIALREVLFNYCGHPENYKNCPFKKTLDGYYERKYEKQNEEIYTDVALQTASYKTEKV